MEFTVDTKAELTSLLKLPLTFDQNILVRTQPAVIPPKIFKGKCERQNMSGNTHIPKYMCVCHFALKYISLVLYTHHLAE